MANKPQKVILHCSATEDSKVTKVSVHDIDSWHKDRGWDEIGYHFYITRDGRIHKGRHILKPGAHTLGHNDTSIGVCYEGRHLPTLQQTLSLIILYKQFRETYGVYHYDWYGHNEYSNKECPGFPISDLVDVFLMGD